MNSEYQPQFEHDLAQAAKPEELEGGQVESTHNPAESLRLGLTRLYEKNSSQIKKQLRAGLIKDDKAKELLAQIDELSLADIGYEISKGLPIELAREIMGSEMCFGPDEVRKAFGIEVRNVPPIPFSRQELERARELDQFLVLRTNIAPDGEPLTMKKINELLQPEFDKEGEGRRVLYPNDWYEKDGRIEPFFVSETPQLEWVLIRRGTIPGSKGKNYLQQTQVLAEYLQYQVFTGPPLPREYRDAINQFNASKDEIRRLIKDDWAAAAQKLSELKINQLCRQLPVEVLYDMLIYFQNTGGRILRDEFAWTRARTTKYSLVNVGGTDLVGISIGGDWPETCRSDIGTSFSRRGVDLKS